MKIAVIGAGSWGTALANVLANNGHNVSLWARRAEVVSSINKEHRNPRYLTDTVLHDDVVATLSHRDAVLRARAAVIVTPSNLLRGVARALADCVDPSFPVIICSKGVEEGSGLLPHEVFASEMGGPERIAVLSGPNHAEEVIRGLPSGTVVASSSPDTARFFRDLFAAKTFRSYTSDDIAGVELCAAFKNVIAIAVGVSYGMGFGDNTAAMLMTRGIAEMSRLVQQAGGNPITCMGLAGAGDLIATCTSEHSRNRRFGKMVAEGKTLADFTNETHMVVEGAMACRNIGTLAAHYDVELPILDAVRKVVWEGGDPEELGRMLAARPLKPEFY